MSMRTKANGSLIALFLMFLLLLWLTSQYSDLWGFKLLLYTVEAGLVGALADWFAVTVLFRHPLGMKWIPHTAIVPRNRNKLVEGISFLVEEQLLSKSMLKEKLTHIQIVPGIIRYGDKKEARRAWGNKIWSWLIEWSKEKDTQELANQINNKANEKLAATEVSPLLGKGLELVLKQPFTEQYINQLFHFMEKKIAVPKTRELIYELLEEQKQKFTHEGSDLTRWFKQKLVQFAESSDAVNLNEAADRLYNDFEQFIRELQEPGHELRQYLQVMLLDLSIQLQHEEDVRQTVEHWKNDLLEQMILLPSIHAILNAIKEMLLQERETDGAAAGLVKKEDIHRWLHWFITYLWRSFRKDKQLHSQLEKELHRFIDQLIEAEHRQIGEIVRRTLDSFTEERLVEFIESKVDTDLQRIRLNGALIGAATGAAIFVFLHGIYKPLLQLLI